MERLSARQLRDVTVHAGECMHRDLRDVLQLVEDNRQRVVLMQTMASAMVDWAAEVTVKCYFEDTGTKISKDKAALSVLRVCMEDQGFDIKV